MILCVTLNPVLDTTLFVDEIPPGAYRVNAQRVTHVAGGKGNNVARALVALGEAARPFEPLGGATGRHQADVLKAEGLDLDAVWVNGETRFVITVVDRAYHQQAFFAPAPDYSPEDVSEIRERLRAALDGVQALCMCGSSPALALDALYPLALREAAARGALTLLDTYGRALELGAPASPTVLKMNCAEAEGLLHTKLDSPDAERAALHALQQWGSPWVILTLGAKGMLAAHGGRAWRGRSGPVQAVNPIGSGDALAAGLLAGILRGLPPEECLRWGMAAAVANLQRWDVCVFTRAEVEAALPLITLDEV